MTKAQKNYSGKEPLDDVIVEDNIKIEEYLPTPPDGGWGWAIVFASFMIHVLADGFTYTFGIFYVSILGYFNVSKSAASWIASILVGVTLGSGPLSGSLVNRYGCRPVTILGALIASGSLFVSIYAESVAVLYLTIGVGAGLGFGLIYLPAIVSVTSYFEKKRSFATGIAVCGSGIGTFAFSPLIKFLIEEYSWKGALIITSGLMLNCMVFGALFRPLETKTKILPIIEEFNGNIPFDMSDGIVIPNKNIPRIEVSNSYDQSTISLKNSEELIRVKSHGILNNHVQYLQHEETARMSVSQPLLPGKENSIEKSFEAPSYALRPRGSLPTVSGAGLFYRKDIFYDGSLQSILEYRSNPMSYRSSVLRLPDLEETDSEKESSKICGYVPCPKDIRESMHNFIGWEMLKDRVFLLFIFSNFCTSIGFNAPYIFMVDRALELGIDSDQASYLLSVVGISNTISRVLLGYISDWPSVNRLYLYNVALTLCGISTMISAWFSGFYSQAVYAAAFGSTSGAYVGLTSVVLVDLLGMEKLTNAFGLLLMFQGIASLIGPPLCGALYEMSKSYDYSFILAGAMIAISGVVLFLIPCAKKMQQRSEERRRNDVSNYA